MSEWLVKARRPHERKFRFVTPRGARNTHKIYAARFSSEETANKTVELNRNLPGTAGWEWKVVPA